MRDYSKDISWKEVKSKDDYTFDHPKFWKDYYIEALLKGDK